MVDLPQIYATPVRTARQARNGLLGLGRNNQQPQQGRNGLLGLGRQNQQLGKSSARCHVVLPRPAPVPL